MCRPDSRNRRARILLFIAAAALSPSIALAQDESLGRSEFSLDIGYANVSLGSNSAIDGEGGLRVEPSLTFAPIEQLPQLRVGGDVGFTTIFDNTSRTIISSDRGTIFVGSSDVPLWLIEPELRVSWRQSLGEDHQFFIEPGIAGGVAFGHFELNDSVGDNYTADSNTAYGRVFLRAGARVTGGLAGFEASWLSGGNLDFGGNASGDYQEFCIGFFGTICF